MKKKKKHAHVLSKKISLLRHHHQATLLLCTFASQNQRGGSFKGQMSGSLAAAVLTRETPLPGAVGQRQQQEEDPTHDKDGSRTADT